MKTVLILCIVTLATIIGDYCIKLSSGKSSGLLSTSFVVGALLYCASAVGWFFLMQSHSLALVGVLFSVSIIVSLAALGVFVFDEPFGWREGIGITLAVLAVAVISYK